MSNRHYPMAGGNIGPREMFNGAAGVCGIILIIQVTSWIIDGIKYLGTQIGF